jgi:hypothetical protein
MSLPQIAEYGSYTYIADEVMDDITLLISRKALVNEVKSLFEGEWTYSEMTIEGVEGMEQHNSMCEPEISGTIRVVDCSTQAALPVCILFSEYMTPLAIWTMSDLSQVPAWINDAEQAEEDDLEELGDPNVYAKICLDYFWTCDEVFKVRHQSRPTVKKPKSKRSKAKNARRRG